VNDTIVTIGSQVWATKNLSVNRYRNGDIIPQLTDFNQWRSATTGAWCWYENDSANYAASYGRLYNWYAVNDPRGLAPAGWHIPSIAEWTTLITTLGGASVAGGALKSTSGWTAPNKGATNSSGFSGLPGGERGISQFAIGGTPQYIGYYGRWWSFGADGTFYTLSHISSSIFSQGAPKHYGFSVRCVKD
jgi:uncharacterized protein (TIGR02145 family)